MPDALITRPPRRRARPPGPNDGRFQRKARTHARIVDATRRLMRAGAWQPACLDVARAAGVSTRSIFQHFEDMAAVYTEALRDGAIAAAIAHQVLPDMALAVPPEVEQDLYARVAHAAVCGRPMPAPGVAHGG